MNERNANWHRLTGEDTVRQLHSNASCGLSRKEARSRFRANGANTLFDPPRATSTLIKRILTDPILLLTAAVSLLAVCFFEPALGITTLIPILIALTVSLRSAILIKKRKDLLRQSEIPTVHAIRQGKAVTLSARSIVQGDILLLRSGDVVPADCRLLSGNRLRIRFAYQRTGEDHPTVAESVKRAEAIYGYGEEIFAPNFDNLVYAGSEILSGSARAIAVEVGAHCFLGAMGNSRGSTFSDGTPRILETIYPYLRLFGFFMLALALPISVVGLLISPKDFSAWRVFLPVCAFAASASATLPSICFEWILHRAAEDRLRDPVMGSISKTAHAIDAMPRTDELILLGRAATSDGLQHFDRAFFDGAEYAPNGEGLEKLQTLSEAFLLLANAEESLPTAEQSAWEGHQPYLSELAHACAFDLGALEVRLLHSSLAESDGERILEVQTKQESFRLRFLSRSANALSVCTEVASENEEFRRVTPQFTRAFAEFSVSARQRSATVVTVLREREGKVAFLGALALREAFLPQIPELIEKTERNGMRVRIFLEKETSRTLTYPQACGCAEMPVRASDGASILSVETDQHFFVGFSRKEIFDTVRTLKKSGKTVAVMGNASADRGVLSAASLRIATVSALKRKNPPAGFEAGDQEGEAKGISAPPTVRRDADLLIPAVSARGGGLLSVLAAKRSTLAMSWRIGLFLRRFASLQIFRAVLFLAVFLSGLGSVSPAVLLFTAWMPDLITLLLTLFSSPSEDALSRSGSFGEQTVRQIFSERGLWLVPSVSALSLFLLITVLRIAGLINYETALPLIAVASVLMQAILLLFGGENGGNLPPKGKLCICFVWLLLPMLAAVLLSVLLPPVAQALELGAWNTASLILLGVSPFLALASSLLLSRFS